MPRDGVGAFMGLNARAHEYRQAQYILQYNTACLYDTATVCINIWCGAGTALSNVNTRERVMGRRGLYV